MLHDKTIIYIDMDRTLCNYDEGYRRHQQQHPGLEFPQSQPGLYINLKPIGGALDTYRWLHEHPRTAVFILTSPSLKNPHCYSEKRLWVEEHLGMEIVGRLIITPHKDLNKGDYLIDDCDAGKGQERFEGELIQFGSKAFPDWEAVKSFFEAQIGEY